MTSKSHENRSDGQSGWVLVGYIVTAAYIGGYVCIVTLTDRVQIPEALPLNAFGDALAGAFAPLAFLWLFVATMVQSQELAEQRKEIAQSREVAKNQGAEMKRQADAMDLQLRVAQQDMARREQIAADEELKQRVEALKEWLALQEIEVTFFSQGAAKVAQALSTDRSTEAVATLRSLRRQLDQVFRGFGKLTAREYDDVSPKLAEPFEILSRLLTDINTVAKGGSPGNVVRYSLLKMDEAVISLGDICGFLKVRHPDFNQSWDVYAAAMGGNPDGAK